MPVIVTCFLTVVESSHLWHLTQSVTKKFDLHLTRNRYFSLYPLAKPENPVIFAGAIAKCWLLDSKTNLVSSILRMTNFQEVGSIVAERRSKKHLLCCHDATPKFSPHQRDKTSSELQTVFALSLTYFP
jgi:hypothetical protein